jgi:hypothetical protein
MQGWTNVLWNIKLTFLFAKNEDELTIQIGRSVTLEKSLQMRMPNKDWISLHTLPFQYVFAN